MATYNVTGPGGTAGHPSKMSAGIRTPYLVENTIDISAIMCDFSIPKEQMNYQTVWLIIQMSSKWQS